MSSKSGKIRKLIDESFIYSYHTTWQDIRKKRIRREILDKDPAENKLTEMLSNALPMDPDTIRQEFERLFKKFDMEEIGVEDIEVDYDGNVTVTFFDDDSELDIIFTYDDDDGCIAIIDDGDEDTDYVVVDFDPMNPAVLKTPFGMYIDMTNLRWVNKSFLTAILTAGDMELDDDDDSYLVSSDDMAQQKNFDRLYHEITQDDIDAYMAEDYISEVKKRVIRGGKAVRLSVVRKKRRKRITGKQKAALRKAARKRKMKGSQIQRKRKKSLKLRKRLGLKKSKLGKHRKVAGTADRKS